MAILNDGSAVASRSLNTLLVPRMAIPLLSRFVGAAAGTGTKPEFTRPSGIQPRKGLLEVTV
jgi:hypothetical protein